MPTKLTRYMEGIMEAAWLAAVVCIPLFFNVYSMRIFEPDKLTLLRSLGLIVLAAWLVKLIDMGGISWAPAENNEPRWKSLMRTPFALAVVTLVVAYLVATVFSVAPSTSFWGSYQRLQGTYTTLTYIVIFAAMAVNLRRRQQLERVITAAILASLPVGLYGLLQRFQIDPVPWGGDTSKRIASNMGNAIFVAAYVIMIFPLVLSRIVATFTAIIKNEGNVVIQIARGTIYIFIAALHVIAVYLSNSRGPLLGMLAGFFFLMVLLSLYWRARWLLFTIMATGLAAAAFLVVLNLPTGPFDQLKQNNAFFNRVGSLLKPEVQSNQVRVLIWEGATELVSSQDPLTFPDGTQDRWEPLRLLVGYGPETMYVAYNPYYPVELAHFESRNASPDRSHNETWDAVVITGLLGLASYLVVFVSAFYYGLAWLKMVNSRKQRILFFGLVIGGGLAGVIGFTFWQGFSFMGVGLPFGILIGVVAYLVLVAVFSRYEAPQTDGEKLRALTLMALLAAIVAHYVEIHFGIAIAATRTHYWVFAALLFVAGYILPRLGEYQIGDDQAVPETEPEAASKKRGRKPTRLSPSSVKGGAEIWVAGLIIALIMVTLGYDFVSNSSRVTTANEIIWNSLTKLPNKDMATSYGVLTMLLTTWISAGLVMAAEISRLYPQQSILKNFLKVLGISLGITMVFYLLHASNLANLGRFPPNTQPTIIDIAARQEGVLTQFYVYLILMLFAMGFANPLDWPQRTTGKKGMGAFALPVVMILAFWGISVTNLRIIHADMTFKFADPLANGASPNYDAAIQLYRRATELAPDEDHYYLFLGRAYLEMARTAEDPAEREELMETAKTDLIRAQGINPLNTDHTANLARLYRVWAGFDPALQDERGQQSAAYYEKATTLSPQNTTLWNEKAIVYLSVLDEREKALEILNQSLEIDPEFDGTNGLLGDFYSQEARREREDEAKRTELLEQAADYYQRAFETTYLNRLATNAVRYNYLVAQASVRAELNDYENALVAYTKALDFVADAQLWRLEETIAQVHAQLGEFTEAIKFATQALESAPENQADRIKQYIASLEAAKVREESETPTAP